MLVFDAITFLVSFLIIFFGIGSKVKTHHERMTQPIWVVWIWMIKQSQILKLGLYDTIINAVATPLLALILPIYAQSLGDTATWLGVWMASFAIGTTLTTTVYTFIGQHLSPMLLLRITPLGQSLGLFIIAMTILLSWPLYWVAIALFFFGMNLGVGSMVDAIILQKQVPQDRRGAVFAAFSSLRFTGVPVGLLVAGLMIDKVGYVPLLIVFSSILIIPSLIWFRETALNS